MVDTPKTLYELVGDENLKKLVNAFYDLVQKNETLSPMFKGEFETIKDKQYCFLSQFLGGPLRYNEKYGHPKMRLRHLPHPIDQNAKTEWLKCMKQAISDIQLKPELAETLYNCFPPVAEHMVNK